MSDREHLEEYRRHLGLLEQLGNSPAFELLMRYVKENADNLAELLMRSSIGPEQVYAQEFQKGVVSGMRQTLVLRETLVETLKTNITQLQFVVDKEQEIKDASANGGHGDSDWDGEAAGGASFTEPGASGASDGEPTGGAP